MKTQRRRRKERRTDYKARLALLKSGMPRLVVRKTNRYIIAQIIKSEIAQDRVIARVSSKDLLGIGWQKENIGRLKSLAAAYLTGLMIAKKYNEKSNELLLDIGLQRNVKGSRVYAVLKGALDGGLKISFDEKALPSIQRIKLNSKVSLLLERIMEKL